MMAVLLMSTQVRRIFSNQRLPDLRLFSGEDERPPSRTLHISYTRWPTIRHTAGNTAAVDISSIITNTRRTRAGSPMVLFPYVQSLFLATLRFILAAYVSVGKYAARTVLHPELQDHGVATFLSYTCLYDLWTLDYADVWMILILFYSYLFHHTCRKMRDKEKCIRRH